MNIGAMRNLVTLEAGPDGTPTAYVPSRVYAAIAPAPPGAFDEQRITHQVSIWYHPQITFDTVIVHQGTRRLYVKGIQNINEQDRELMLLCEEVKTP